jgi:hypothetical protein
VIAIPPEVWQRLGAPPEGEFLRARIALPDVTARVLVAVDSARMRHLLIALESNETDLRDTQSRGLSVVTRELHLPGSPLARYLDITCHEIAGHSVFDLIGGEIGEVLRAGTSLPAEIVSRVLAKWRRFWGELPTTALRREETVGLFGELWFLSMWLLPIIGTQDAVASWRGPFGARHDFEWPGCSVEVKATTLTRGRIHKINGIDQLEPPENGKLLFFSLLLREEGGATNTLPALVKTSRVLLQSDANALTRFETGLLRSGYSPAHDEEYEKLKFRIADGSLFVVRENFPRVTNAQFTGGLSRGVERISYEINLGGFEHLRLARSPFEEADWSR